MSRKTIYCIIGYSVTAGLILRFMGIADYAPEAYAAFAGSAVVAINGVMIDAQEGL